MAANEIITGASIQFTFGVPLIYLTTTVTYTEDGFSRPLMHQIPEALLDAIAQASQSLNIWNKNTILIGFASGAFEGL